MLSFLRWIFSTIIIVLAVLFALANREVVSFTFSPFHDPITLPLYALGLGLMVLGFMVGSVVTWLGMHHVRKERRQAQKTIKNLEKEIVTLKTNVTLPSLRGGEANEAIQP